MGSAAVLVTDSLYLPASAVLWTLRTFPDHRLNLLTRAHHQPVVSLTEVDKASSLDAVISLGVDPSFHTSSWLELLYRIVKPGGVLIFQEPQIQRSGFQIRSALERNLLLTGFTDLELLATTKDLIFSGFDEHCILIRAKKPIWEIGSSFSLRKKKEQQQPQGALIMLPDVDTLDMDDLIDEDTLLTEEDLKAPQVPKADDCEVGKSGRKACKNCTCGRAEMEEQNMNKVLEVEKLSNPQSACGSCGLGDAFRCGSCPYRGLPPFKLGEKVTLPGTLLTADV